MTHYQVLDVATDASQDEIKTQYRFLAQAWHPDKFPNAAQKAKAEEKLKEINAAYEILSNPIKRASYDRSANISTPPYHQHYSQPTPRPKASTERGRTSQKPREKRAQPKPDERPPYDPRTKRIDQINQEIFSLNEEIASLSQNAPAAPRAAVSFFLILGGLYVASYVMTESATLGLICLIAGGLAVIAGILLFVQRNWLIGQSREAVRIEIETRNRKIQQLRNEQEDIKKKTSERFDAG